MTYSKKIYMNILLVCISVVIGLLAVWRHNKPKTQKIYYKCNKNKHTKPTSINKMKYKIIYYSVRVCVLHSCWVFMDVCFVLFLFCMSKCVCVCLQVQGPLRECLWARRFWDSLLLQLHLCAFLLDLLSSCSSFRSCCVAKKPNQKQSKDYLVTNFSLSHKLVKNWPGETHVVLLWCRVNRHIGRFSTISVLEMWKTC